MDRRTRNSFENMASSSLSFDFHSPRMCMVELVFFRKNAAVAILTADSKRSFLASWTELPISVRLAMCPAERERDSSGCRASGITLEQPLHVLLVLLLLVKGLSHHSCVLTESARRPEKIQNAMMRAVRSPRAQKQLRSISVGRRGDS